ncbi:MAG: hypothetical protein QW607_05195 [Desulfurococcaceae archaeon]
MANLYLVQTVKETPIFSISEAELYQKEIINLRSQLFSLQEEAFSYRERIKQLEAFLFRLSELILAGEGLSVEANKIAQMAMDLLLDGSESRI